MQQYQKYWGYTIAPVVLILAIAYWSFEFIEQTIRNHPELNLMILIVIALSVFLVFARQHTLWKEAKVFEDFRKIYVRDGNPDAAYSFLKGKQARVVGLLKTVGTLDGKIERTIDQQALATEMDALKEHFSATMSLPTFMSGFMVALGLFGTFVGLLETLKSSGELLAGFSQGSTGDLEGAVTGMLVGMKGPLSGMATAFSASLFGLLGSLLIGIMINSCQSMGRHIEHELRVFVGKAVKMTANTAGTVAGAPEQVHSNAFLRDMMARVMDQQTIALGLFEQSRQTDLETKAAIVSAVGKLSERAEFIERSVSVLEDMKQIVKSQATQTQTMLDQVERQGRMMEAVHSRMINAERAGDNLERTATQMRETLQTTITMLKSMSHAQSQLDERQERLMASGLEAVSLYHQSMVDTQQRLLDGLKDLGGQIAAEVVRFDQRQSGQISKFIDLQTRTSDVLHKISEEKTAEQPDKDYVIEIGRDIRKSRELLNADFTAEFREIKRMMNFVMKRVGG
jgi:hypothetical protein